MHYNPRHGPDRVQLTKFWNKVRWETTLQGDVAADVEGWHLTIRRVTDGEGFHIFVTRTMVGRTMKMNITPATVEDAKAACLDVVLWAFRNMALEKPHVVVPAGPSIDFPGWDKVRQEVAQARLEGRSPFRIDGKSPRTR